ncbi:MAG: sigma-54-dependent Fis family transcriptional regulator [Spirochaetales bacterium]|nr:sigma-54-dependent Fis family transcriptional regulator [Spirochaetales bacterium]
MNETDRPILLVDDEETVLTYFTNVLETAGITNVKTCKSQPEVMKILTEKEFSVITLDLVIPGVTGLNLLNHILSEVPNTPVIVITATHDLDIAINCMKKGAFDFLVKPVNVNRLLSCVRHALTEHEVKKENMRLKEVILSDALKNPDAFSDITANNKTMLALFKYVEAVAPTSLPILITGETGVGKELFARAVHKSSGRKGDFMPVNIAGLDDQMFSDTLFGHIKGAFTGTAGERRGMIARAKDGTLFLDEIGDLSQESQVKLLRLIQEREYYPLGSDSAVLSNVRFVFATNRDLESLVESGKYRKDLYYRLSSHHIRIPPLRERKDDLSRLVDFFWNKARNELGKGSLKSPDDMASLLMGYDFPGNIRELEGLIFELLIHFDDKGGVKSFLEKKLGKELAVGNFTDFMQPDGVNPFCSYSSLPSIKQAVNLLVEETLIRTNGNQGKAAKLLGITRTALNKRLHRSPREA